MVAIRRGEVADAPVLAAFASRCFVDTYAADNRPEDIRAHVAASFGPERQARELGDAGVDYLLALRDATLLGFAQLRRHPPPPCVTQPGPRELHRFYVDRSVQGSGLAQRLMAAVFETARSRHAGHLWLSVWERNPRAIAFYKRCGFVDVGEKDFYVGPDRQRDRVLLASVEAAGPPSA